MKIVNTMRNKLLILFLLVSAIPILINWFILVAVQSENNLVTAESMMESGLEASVAIMEEQVAHIWASSRPPETAGQLETLFFVKKADLRPVAGEGMVTSISGGREEIYLELDTEEMIKAMETEDGSTLKFLKNKDSLEAAKSAIKIGNEDKITAVVPVFDERILAVKTVSKAAVLETSTYWSDIAIRASMIMMIVAISISYAVSYRYTQGMETLARDMRRIRKGDFSDMSTIKGNDEIAQLSHTFYHMADEMNTLVNKTLRLTISERDAKIKAMQSQISPHFLYNALDSINWNLLKKGDFESSDILVSLSGILRYSIDDTKELVTLGEEFRQMENYLIVQKNRFSDRFDYKIDLEDSLSLCQVPKMILQPLVENAISHGLEDGVEGKLEITGKEIPQGIEVTVWDNGKGINKKDLVYIRDQMNKSGQIANDQDFHLGIANVHNRLRYRYGEGSGLEIDSKEGEYTLVTLRILLESDTV